MNTAFLLAAIAAFCGGLVPVVGKIALEVFHPFTVVTLRFVFSTLFLLPFVYKSREIKKQFFIRLFVVSLIGALNPIIFFISFPFVKASVSPLIYACVPALTALYFFVTTRCGISRKQGLGIAMGLVGVAIVILLPVLQKGNGIAALAGNVLILVAAFAFMLYGILSKKKQQDTHVSPLALTFYFSLVTFIVSVPFTVGELMVYGIPSGIEVQHVASVVAVGIVGTGIFYITYQYALKMGSAVAAALFTYLQPIATVGLAAMLLGERVTLLFVIGGILSVVGARIAAQK